MPSVYWDDWLMLVVLYILYIIVINIFYSKYCDFSISLINFPEVKSESRIKGLAMQGIPIFFKEGLCGRMCRGQSKENADCDGPGSHRLGSERNDSLVCTLNYLHLADSSTCITYWFRCNLVLETHFASYQPCSTGQVMLAAKELCSVFRSFSLRGRHRLLRQCSFHGLLWNYSHLRPWLSFPFLKYACFIFQTSDYAV